MGLRTALGLKKPHARGHRETYDSSYYTTYGVAPPTFWPLVLPIIGMPRSLLDIGCGSGHWTAALAKIAPDLDYIGIEHPESPDDGIFIDRTKFYRHDLSRPFDLGRRFDLALCLEVAEHLPAASAEGLVQSITHHTDEVIFSAAIPGQGGHGHVNLQWPGYWIELFAKKGFRFFDVIRPIIWENPDISYWYKQNTFLVSRVRTSVPGPDWNCAPLVHPELFKRALGEKSVA